MTSCKLFWQNLHLDLRHTWWEILVTYLYIEHDSPTPHLTLTKELVVCIPTQWPCSHSGHALTNSTALAYSTLIVTWESLPGPLNLTRRKCTNSMIIVTSSMNSSSQQVCNDFYESYAQPCLKDTDRFLYLCDTNATQCHPVKWIPMVTFIPLADRDSGQSQQWLS